MLEIKRAVQSKGDSLVSRKVNPTADPEANLSRSDEYSDDSSARLAYVWHTLRVLTYTARCDLRRIGDLRAHLSLFSPAAVMQKFLGKEILAWRLE